MKKILIFFFIFSFFIIFPKKVIASWSCNGSYQCITGQNPDGSLNTQSHGCDSGCMGGQCYCIPAPDNCPGGMSGSSCHWVCHGSCSAPNCGQNNGCGVSCSSSDVGNISWGACFDPGACGSHNLIQNGTDPCGNSYQQTCGSTCTECGPYYGAWSACSAYGYTPNDFTRRRQRTYDCRGSNFQYQTCQATFQGTLFDASIPNDCSTYASQPPIAGTMSVTSTVNQLSPVATYTGTLQSNGGYSITTLVPDTYDITYNIDETSYITDPPKLLCDGALEGITVSTQSQTITRRIGLYRIYGGWFQNIGGDIYADSGISMIIPATCILGGNNCNNVSGTTDTPLIADPAAGTTGLPFVRTGTVDMGGGGSVATNAVFSSEDWSATGTGYALRNYDYGFFFHWFSTLRYTNWDGTGKPSGASNALYQHTGDITWDQSLNAGEKIALLVDGNVTISANVTVPQDAYLAIIASGNINFTSTVTEAHGHYIANGNLTVSTTGDVDTDQRFNGQGVFVGWSGIVLQRDRGITNNSESSELFTARPDLVINAPRGMRNPKIDWQEVAP